MASTPPPVPPMQGDEFEAWLQEQIKNQMATVGQGPGAAPPAPPAPPPAQPITVNLGGQAFTFNSQDELNAALNNTFAQYNEQLAALRQQQAPPSGPGQMVSGNDAPQFDMNSFVDTFVKNPADAIEKAIEMKLGMPLSALKEAAIKADSQEKLLAAYQFKDANPDFPGGNQAAQVMQRIMEARHLPYTAEGLEAAWLIAQRYRLLQPLRPQVPQPPPDAYPQPGPPPMPPGPPRIGRGGPEMNPAIDPEELSADQIAAILAKFQG